MVWCRLGDKSLSKPMLTDSLTHICGTRWRWVNRGWGWCCIKTTQHVPVPDIYGARTWDLIQFKYVVLPVYRKYHCGDKTVVKSSYLQSRNSYISKMTSLYWIFPKVITAHVDVVALSSGDWKDTPYFLWHMMTSSNGKNFRVTGPLCGEFTGPGEFPTQRPVTRSFDVFFDLCLNKRLSKQ